jgi:hypothetical protein
MLKLCQLIAAFCVDWVMVVLPVALLMVAPPADTMPPAGDAKAFVPNDIIKKIASAFRVKHESALSKAEKNSAFSLQIDR